MRPHSERAAAALRAMDAIVKRMDEIANNLVPRDPVQDLLEWRERTRRRNRRRFRAIRDAEKAR